ncbi:hypothetical protein CRENBAI_010765 [Crenichthys baileyi]|uniref:Uncharacterized protein n=1 Tax=Crenichthys baileyi TaxID=28760 RepID=A0AAV9QVE8_9TELE
MTLSDSGYPYLSYVVVDMEFPKKAAKAPTIMCILVLICPNPPGLDHTSAIIRTNAKANLSKRLAKLFSNIHGIPAHAFGIQSSCSSTKTSILPTLPVGVVVQSFFVNDVTIMPFHQSKSEYFGTSQIDFGESPVLEQRKTRLRLKKS